MSDERVVFADLDKPQRIELHFMSPYLVLRLPPNATGYSVRRTETGLVVEPYDVCATRPRPAAPTVYENGEDGS